ncbi:aldose epimerase family protein [Tenggerimyces flavus]|uniref:DUF5107 domain-containing protein n=1 Tax=Tenggerimyces flavus TaxID=1708749 RepID=A0ABV7Y6A4_9ACTN|nr:hypothetical protein [Tenggerimyces flavus]MBM7791180.1 galactose mutarotase-like enzyme [Tenggerimyces flavus]
MPVSAVLENASLRAVFLPELGGKLWQLVDKRTGFDLLWQHPSLAPRAVPFGSPYDDVFFGGWDELFPNDVPEVLGGVARPDHGEVWSMPWEWSELSPSSARLAVSPGVCRVSKVVTLDGASLRFRYRIVNEGADPLPYLWKPHVAVALDDDSLVELEAGTMLVDPWGSPRGGLGGASYTWPYAVGADGVTYDLRTTLPSSSGVSELQYATSLERGWCAVRHPSRGTGLGLSFDASVLRSCWTFASYGGWRDLRVLVLEPCTGYPLSVLDGVAAGSHQVLAAGGVVSCDMTASVLS